MATYWELEYKQGESGTWTTLSSTIPEGTAYYDQTGTFVSGETYYGRVRCVVDSVPETWSKEFLAVYSTTVNALVADELIVGSPELGTPALSENAATSHALAAQALAVSSPVLDTPEFASAGASFIADNLSVSPPAVGTPAITQIHVLGCDGLATPVPVLGSPVLSRGNDDLPIAVFVNEGPVLGTPQLGQVHALTATFETLGPIFGQPEISQIHGLLANGLVVQPPAVGAPRMIVLNYVLQTRFEASSIGTMLFEASSAGTTRIELICIGNFEVNEFGE